MSGADSYIMSGSASVTRNIYQQYVHPDATDRQMLKASRLSVLLISVIGLVSALFAKGIIPFLILFTKIVGAGLVFPFLALMFWRRATQKGVTAGMITGVLVTVGWNIAGNPFVIQAVPGYLSSLVAIIVVSLLTSHAADEQVEALYPFGR
jgi:SSS family solute:Na+ symporter